MSKKQDDAARIASLAGILQSGNQPKHVPPSPAPPAAAASVPAPAPRAASRASKKERVGKYRDPHWHQYGVYLRKDTHKRSRRRLEDTEPDKDLSDLLEELLQQWLASSK
jgi:hypothetical protein